MKTYTLEACEQLIDVYVNKYKGEMVELDEGVLGLGTILLYGGEKRKTIVIKEVYLNAWSSGHTVRQYNKMPKKYEEMLENV